MRVLVIGGAGFIGSHLVDRLTTEGNFVTVVDNLSSGREENLSGAFATGLCELVKLDITDPGLPEVVAAAAPDAIVNFAAQIDVRVSVVDPLLDATTNILGTVAALEAARQAGVARVVLASSVAIYGPPETLPVTEESRTNPLSPYAVSKLAGELYLRQYQALHGVETTTLVLGNVYGPRQSPHGEAGVVAIFSDAMLSGQPTRVYGDGGHTRDYVYVEDVADAFARALRGGAGSPRINIGTGIATSDLDLNRAIAHAVGGAAEPVFAPARLGDLAHMVVDAGLAQRCLGWRPRTPLTVGIERTVAAMRASAATS